MPTGEDEYFVTNYAVLGVLMKLGFQPRFLGREGLGWFLGREGLGCSVGESEFKGVGFSCTRFRGV